MFCPSSHSLFLRSNGTLVCWDDYGSLKELQEFDAAIDYASNVYLGPVYRNIRKDLHNGVMPFPDHCARCHCLEAGFGVDTEHYTRAKAVETFQIEPSMGCQLECPGCIPRADRRARVRKTSAGHMTLDPMVLHKIVRDFHAAGITVKKFDMQGHGEPLLHKQLWDMTAFIAELYPHSVNSICTHANGRFEPRMIRSGVNEVLFSIDGVDQASYAPYRVFGDFDRAFAFMAAFSHAAASDAPQIERVWKYVVFNHNDTDAQLLRAQEMALEAQVSTLRFVLTQLGPASRRIVDGDAIPVLDPALRITVDSYRIKYEQLHAALASIGQSLRKNDTAAAVQWANAFANSMFRLFGGTRTVPDKYRQLIEEYDDLIASQSAEHFGAAAVIRNKSGPPGKTRLQWDTDQATKLFRPNSNIGLLPPPAAAIDVGTFTDVIARIEVDEAWYLRTYPDIAADIAAGKVTSASQHYLEFGFLEHRLPYQPLIDEAWYRTTYPDVPAAIDDGAVEGVADHFVHHGYHERRQASPQPQPLPAPIAAAAAAAPTLASSAFWLANPIVEREVARRIGCPSKHWLHWIFEDQIPVRPRRLLSVGCGDGSHELIIARHGFAAHVDASTAHIARAQDAARAEQLDINFFVDDFDHWAGQDTAQRYDAVLLVASLHHVLDLERLLARLRQVLTDDGVVIFNEYVGPNHGILPEHQVETINRLLAAIPDRFKPHPDITWLNPDIDTVLRSGRGGSPRSCMLPQLLHLYFDVTWQAGFGGAVLHPIFTLLQGAALADGSDESRTVLQFLIATENILMQSGVLQNDFLLGLARQKTP